jgi:hypothetical protein
MSSTLIRPTVSEATVGLLHLAVNQTVVKHHAISIIVGHLANACYDYILKL